MSVRRVINDRVLGVKHNVLENEQVLDQEGYQAKSLHGHGGPLQWSRHLLMFQLSDPQEYFYDTSKLT